MYEDKYSKLKNEKEILDSKDEEFRLFYNYVKKIYIRCRKAGYTQGRTLWEDFPYDFYEDVDSWINCNNMKEVKKKIDWIKFMHDCVRESARLFWMHWLNYRNAAKRQNKINISNNYDL